MVASILKIGNLEFVHKVSITGTDSCSLANEHGKHFSNFIQSYWTFINEITSLVNINQRLMMLSKPDYLIWLTWFELAC